MKFIRTDIPDVILVEPEAHQDGRGFFFEFYSKKIFFENGIDVDFVQDNHSASAKGVLRGLHYQLPPKSQAKLMKVIKGEAFDVVVDIRKGSKTFGKAVSHILSAKNKKMLFVPAGFAHGFCALENDTEFLYKVSDFYSREHERGIIWNDPAIGIPWPKLGCGYTLSEKDEKYPLLQESHF